MIDIVFFDAGDTLLGPHPSFQEVFASVCHDAGYRVSADEVGAVQERLAPHLVDIAHESGVTEGWSLNARDSRKFWTFLYRTFLRDLGIEDEGLAGRLLATFSSTSSYALFDDALPTLRALEEEGYRLGLISNFESWLENLLVELEVGDTFDVSVISGVEGVEKPDVRIYELALERAAVDPERAVHVGDSMSNDIEPARRAGMRTVLLDRAGRYGACPAPCIRSLSELPATLAEMQRS